ncbi:hypothetical protein [Cryobacterium serini]|uniref:Uncharacterized protein n=1 Tax=Cryobacterium serini TaxID=1259201 RepID=A0A4R9BKS5_9MICO|nr:hypothetical protein [Cryobacterium serini]TFD86584.1 hypothetical protein E3T51_11570 [Cryobacterium serini]
MEILLGNAFDDTPDAAERNATCGVPLPPDFVAFGDNQKSRMSVSSERSPYIIDMGFIGYARIPTPGENPDGQTDALAVDGCIRVFVAPASEVGAKRSALDDLLARGTIYRHLGDSTSLSLSRH